VAHVTASSSTKPGLSISGICVAGSKGHPPS
jgi:hypothetical protein